MRREEEEMETETIKNSDSSAEKKNIFTFIASLIYMFFRTIYVLIKVVVIDNLTYQLFGDETKRTYQPVLSQKIA